MTYSEKLKDPRWQKKRLLVLERDNWTCRHCGDKSTELQVHHLKYNGNPWDAKSEDLITVCKVCHAVEEFIKKGTHPFDTKMIVKSLKALDSRVFEVAVLVQDRDKDLTGVVLFEFRDDQLFYGITMNFKNLYSIMDDFCKRLLFGIKSVVVVDPFADMFDESDKDAPTWRPVGLKNYDDDLPFEK